MLAPKVVAAVVFVWVVAALLGGLYEMSYLTDVEQSSLNKILYFNVATTEGTWGVVELAAAAPGFLMEVWRMATFQFAFISGEYELVRWVVFFPLTAYLVYGLIMTVIGILRGTIGGGA